MEKQLSDAIKAKDFKMLKQLLNEVVINEPFNFPIGC
eukprot:gene13191-9619_t